MLAASQASAQFGGGMGGMGGMGGRHGMRGGGDSSRSQSSDRRDAADAVHVTLAELENDLRLTAEQKPKWDAFRQKVEALAGDVARSRTRPISSQKEDAVHQVNRLVDLQRDRLTAMEDIAQAATDLYATLGDEQKAIADERFAGMLRGLSTIDGGSTATAQRGGGSLPKLQ